MTKRQLQLLVTVVVFMLLLEETDGVRGYYYKHYSFRKKQKNERKIRNLQGQCESKEDCQDLYGLDRIRCVRICMSSHCYNELYSHDELEEGEIDVRYNSFKGCILQTQTL